jgi:hypothetical protein
MESAPLLEAIGRARGAIVAGVRPLICPHLVRKIEPVIRIGRRR